MNENIYRVLYSACSCVIGVLVISFSMIIFLGFSSNNDQYMETLNNWELSPIIGLEVLADIQSDCAPNQTSVFQYNWPGTMEGCLCSKNNQVEAGACCDPRKEEEKNCCHGTPINSIPGQDLDIWSIQSSVSKTPIKFKLCATRLPDYTYRENSPQSSDCLASEKWCGKDANGDKDINYGFCVPVNQKCPIQEILIGENNPNPKLYESIKIKEDNGNKLQFFVNREGPSKLPLIDFRISASSTVCLDSFENVGINQGYSLNYLSSTCSLTDSQFVKTNISINSKDFLQANSQVDSLNSLPNYQYSTDQLTLYTKSYTSLRMNCRGGIEQFYGSIDTLNSVKYLSLPILILCSSYSSILLLFETWIGFKYTRYSWGVIIFKNVNCLLKSFYLIKYILFLACNVLTIIEACYQIEINNFLYDITNKQCLQTTDDFFTFLSKGKIKEYSIAILLCIWMHFLAEPNVFYVINKCCCSQIQQKMQLSTATNSVKNQNKHNQSSSKEISIIIEKPEEKQLPQNDSYSYEQQQQQQVKSPLKQIGLKKTVSYKF